MIGSFERFLECIIGILMSFANGLTTRLKKASATPWKETQGNGLIDIKAVLEWILSR